MNRTDRMFAIVVDLQAHKIQRGEDFAARYETSVRTIYRDVEALCEAGIPVVSLPGQGYTLPADYFLPPLSFELEEAASLLLGADYVAQTLDPAYRAAALAAVRKIEAIVPAALRVALERTRRGIRLVGNAPEPRQLELLRVFRTAIGERRIVSFRYRGRRTEDAAGRGDVSRRIAPYAVAHMRGRWYVIGHSYERNALRRFRLSRVDEARTSAEGFELPTDFRLEPPDATTDLPVLVRVAFEETELPAMQERLAAFDATLQSDGAQFIATFRTYNEAAMTNYVLGWGGGVRVLEPAGLRERVVAQARRIVEYAPDIAVSATSE